MMANINKNYITVFATNFSHLLESFYLLNYKIWGMLQDQNQGCPRAMRVHWGRMPSAGSAHHRQSHWRVAKETSRLCGCRRRTVWT